MKMDKIKILTRIISEEMTALEYIGFCKGLLADLMAISPDFKNLSVWDDETDKVFYLQDDLSDFDERNFYRIIHEDKELAYKNTDSTNKDLSLCSKSWAGFHSLFFFADTKGTSVSDIKISLTQGSYEPNDICVINIEFSDVYQSKLTKEFIEAIISVLAKHCKLIYVAAISNEFRSKVAKKGQDLWIGWLTYINRIEISDLLPADIEQKPLKDGVLFSLSSERVESTDEALVQTAIEIRDVLGEKGLLNYPI